MKEVVIISGKGGTGKTSLTASFALLSKQAIIADCDVDAANLYLLLTPDIQETNDFWCGQEAKINMDKCTACGACLNLCRFNAIKEENGKYTIDTTACEGCGVCAQFCPHHAVDLQKALSGKWMISNTRAGMMVHAKLGIGAENSGRLVSLVREKARALAEKQKKTLVLIDGPPGIGCAVIASLTGASSAVIITEPTVSGEHDLLRALELTKHFKVPTYVCVNKWDLDPERTHLIENKAQKNGAKILGRVRYDYAMTEAQKESKTIIETNAEVSHDVQNIWDSLYNEIRKDHNL